jgi:hypothetical protein
MNEAYSFTLVFTVVAIKKLGSVIKVDTLSFLSPFSPESIVTALSFLEVVYLFHLYRSSNKSYITFFGILLSTCPSFPFGCDDFFLTLSMPELSLCQTLYYVFVSQIHFTVYTPTKNNLYLLPSYQLLDSISHAHTLARYPPSASVKIVSYQFSSPLVYNCLISPPLFFFQYINPI